MSMNPRLLRPRASGFDPRSIAGLAGWWDAQQASSITIDTGVSQWSDLSGLGRHLTQATANNQPTRETDAGVGGKFVIRFDGLNDRLRATFTQTKPVTIFCVHKFAASPLNATVYDGVALNTARLFAQNNTSLTAFAGAFLSVLGLSPGNSEAFCVSEVVFDSGSSSRISVNGLFTNAGSAGTAAFGGLTLAAEGGLGAFSAIDIAEVLLYADSLSSTPLSRIRKYLGLKYGITVA